MTCSCENNVPQEYNNTSQSCNYTKEQIESWKDLVLCIRDNDYLNNVGITQHQLNILIGTILSALRIENPCFLKENLDSIYNQILQISSYNLC